MSLGLKGSSAGANASGWKEVARFDTAGNYTWTCPKTATYGVFVVGGGGSGGAGVILSSGYYYAYGGASGYVNHAVVSKTAGNRVTVKVGAGGASVTQAASKGSTSGKSGGDSSFGALSAAGGEGGAGNTSNTAHSAGAAYANFRANGVYGPNEAMRVETSTYTLLGMPWMRRNPFTCDICIGSGGFAMINNSPTAEAYAGGKHPLTGLGGGDGGANANGKDATEFGCGGGGAANYKASVTSGAGADGIVIIYEKLE